MKLSAEDLRIETYSVDSTVRITHLPTGLVVTCADEKASTTTKNRRKNRAKAFRLMRSRLREYLTEEG